MQFVYPDVLERGIASLDGKRPRALASGNPRAREELVAAAFGLGLLPSVEMLP